MTPAPDAPAAVPAAPPALGGLSRWQLLRVALRSLLVQASWNYRGMMNMGFLFTLKPGLDRIHPDGEARAAAYARHLEYFNTNPYFSALVAGVVLSLEERLARGEIAPDIIRDTKEGLMTAFAAVGDGLFWDSWRPFVAVLALTLAFGNVLYTPLLFLLVYNLPHAVCRFAGVFVGYRQGTDVIHLVHRLDLPRVRLRLRQATLVVLCFLAPNHVNLQTPYLLEVLPVQYFVVGQKVVQGLGALLLVGVLAMAHRARIDVLMISFLLMTAALLLHHWGVLI